MQIVAVTVGAGLGGIGGAQLSIGYVDNWFNNMTSGYGFVAVAVVLFAAWNPVRVMLGGGTCSASRSPTASVLQAHGVSINQYLLDALPYLVTLVALAVFTRKGQLQAPEGANPGAEQHELRPAFDPLTASPHERRRSRTRPLKRRSC